MTCASESQWQSDSDSIYLNQGQMIREEDNGGQNQKKEGKAITNRSLQILKFQQLCSQKYNKCEATELLWKIHCVLGQLVLSIQRQLVQKQIIKQAVLLQFSLIHKVTSQLFTLASQSPKDEEFLKIKSQLFQLCSGKNSDQQMIQLYNRIIKISRRTCQFGLTLGDALNEQNVQLVQQTKKNNTFLQKIEQIKRKKLTITNNRTSQPKPPLKRINYKNERLERGPRGGKLSELDQAIICKIYAETNDLEDCIQSIERQLGPDLRWSYPNQIENRMEGVAIKVLNKFTFIKSNNSTIQTFIKNRKKVFAVVDARLKRQIFKHIAFIYYHMINKTNSSFREVTERMNEVNRLCQQVVI